MGAPTISSLHIYPVKSCKGIALQSASLMESGLYFDREWMVVRADSGRFCTQREIPKMALIETALPTEALIGGWGSLPPDAALTLSAPGMPILKVQLVKPVQAQQTRHVTCWEFKGTAADEGEDAAQWFSKYLGFPACLVRYLGSQASATTQPGAIRNTDPMFAVGYEVRFADGYPMLLATEAALQDLNQRLQKPLPMNRFRPNIVVAGTGPWAEDNWSKIFIKPQNQPGTLVEFDSVKPCGRCKVTTVDQAKGEVAGDEPLKTLAEFRTGKQLGWNKEHKSFTHSVFFGHNVVSKASGVVLSVGDEVQGMPLAAA